MASIGTLYGATFQAKTVTILAAAKYSGLELTFKETNPLKGEAQAPEYKAKFPYGKIPGFEGSDGLVLSEGRAIARYVSGISDNVKLLGTDAKSAAYVDLWTNWADDELFNNGATLFTMANGGTYFKPTEQKTFEKLDRALSHLEQTLHTTTFLVGHRITLADLAVATNVKILYTYMLGPEIRSKYPNVLRYVNTVVNQPQLGDVLSKDFKLAAETIKCAPKKEEKPKAAAAPAAPAAKKEKKPKAVEDDEEEPLVPEEPKQKNPLDDLPKSPFVLDEWKRQYSNKDTRSEALPWFWENFDAQGWSLWKIDFKYNEEL
ncbi:hypothetical protein CF326_g8429, partial [Tilletia indica]